MVAAAQSAQGSRETLVRDATLFGDDARLSGCDVVLAGRAVAGVIEHELAGSELVLDDWLVMEALARSPGSTMAELKNYTLTPAPTLTRVVDRLVMRSLAFREVDGQDRRKIRVRLSKRGTRMHTQLAPVVRSAEQAWFASL